MKMNKIRVNHRTSIRKPSRSMEQEKEIISPVALSKETPFKDPRDCQYTTKKIFKVEISRENYIYHPQICYTHRIRIKKEARLNSRSLSYMIFDGTVVLLLLLALALSPCVVHAEEAGSGLDQGRGAGFSRASLWILLCIFLMMSAFFSGSETSLFSLDALSQSKLKQMHPHEYLIIKALLDHPKETLTSILFMNRFVNIGATLSAGTLAMNYLSPYPILSFAAGALGVTLLILILGEILPKTLAMERPYILALVLAPFLTIFIRLIKPIRLLMDFISLSLFNAFHFSPARNVETTSEEDLKMMLLSGEFDGLLEEDERDMIDGVFEFGEKTAEDIMTPRIDLEAYPFSFSQEHMLEAARKCSHNRVLIYEEDIDHIRGVLHVKDLLLNQGRNYTELIRSPFFVPSKKKLTLLLRDMQKNRQHLAIIVDEYGGMAGIVTLTNLLEEIVGDIRDAREAAREQKEVIQTGPDHFNLAGKMEVKEINELLGLNLEEESSRTLSGFVLNALGKIPTEGEEFEKSGWHFRIMKMDGNRIERISMRKQKQPAKQAESPREKEDPGV